MVRTITIVNQKSGVGKTSTCTNLGIGLAREGKKVLLVNSNPQESLSIGLGSPHPDRLPGGKSFLISAVKFQLIVS